MNGRSLGGPPSMVWFDSYYIGTGEDPYRLPVLSDTAVLQVFISAAAALLAWYDNDRTLIEVDSPGAPSMFVLPPDALAGMVELGTAVQLVKHKERIESWQNFQ